MKVSLILLVFAASLAVSLATKHGQNKHAGMAIGFSITAFVLITVGVIFVGYFLWRKFLRQPPPPTYETITAPN